MRKEEIETVSERSSRRHAVGKARAIFARGNLAAGGGWLVIEIRAWLIKNSQKLFITLPI